MGEEVGVCGCAPRPPPTPPAALRGAHRERPAPGRDVDGVLLFADALQTGQGRLLRAVGSAGTPTLPTAPVRSRGGLRGAPSRPSRLPRLLLLPPLESNAQGQVLREVVHCGVPSGLHVPGAGEGPG